MNIKAWDKIKNVMVDGDMLFINDESDSGSASLNTTLEKLTERYDLLLFTEDGRMVKVFSAPVLLTACIRAHDALLCLHVCDQDQTFADETRTTIREVIAKAEA
jgi:hypothetical protein